MSAEENNQDTADENESLDNYVVSSKEFTGPIQQQHGPRQQQMCVAGPSAQQHQYHHQEAFNLNRAPTEPSPGPSSIASSPLPKKSREQELEQIFPFVAVIHRQLKHVIADVGEGTFQQKVMKAIKEYANGIRDEYEDAMVCTDRCRRLARSLGRILDLLHDICANLTDSHEYLHRISELVAIYISCELSYANEFREHKPLIANRISYIIQKHLKISNDDVTQTNILRVFVFMPKMYKEREVMNNIFKQFIMKPHVYSQQELPDKIYVQYIIVFYQWKQLEINAEDQMSIVDYADKFMRPAKTLSSNTNYANHLPKYTSRRTATRFILLNLKFFQDLRNASIYDNCLKGETGLIDLSDDDPIKSSINFAEVYAQVETQSFRTPIKLENPLVVSTIDLTEDDTEGEENDNLKWLEELKYNVVKTTLSNIGTSSLVATADCAGRLQSSVEVIEIDSDSDDNADEAITGTCDEIDSSILPIEFQEPDYTDCERGYYENDISDDSGGEDDDVTTSRHQREKSENDPTDDIESSSCLQSGDAPNEMQSFAVCEEMPSTSTSVNNAIVNYSTSATDFALPRIVDSFSYRRDSIHLMPSDPPNANDGDFDEHMTEEDNIADGLQSIEPTLESETGVTLGKIIYTQTKTRPPMVPDSDFDFMIFNESIDDAPNQILNKKPVKQVKFNDNVIVGPIRSHGASSDMKAPIKPAININRYNSNSQRTIFSTEPLEARSICDSPATSSASSSCEVLKELAQKERMNAVAKVFSEYISFSSAREPSSKDAPKTVHSTSDPQRLSKFNLHKRRATMVDCSIIQRHLSSSPSSSSSSSSVSSTNLSNGTESSSTQMVYNVHCRDEWKDAKLRKPCTVEVDRHPYLEKLAKRHKEEKNIIEALEVQREKRRKLKQIRKRRRASQLGKALEEETRLIAEIADLKRQQRQKEEGVLANLNKDKSKEREQEEEELASKLTSNVQPEVAFAPPPKPASKAKLLVTLECAEENRVSEQPSVQQAVSSPTLSLLPSEKEQHKQDEGKSVPKEPKEQNVVSLPSSLLAPSKKMSTIGKKVQKKRKREECKSVPKQAIVQSEVSISSTATIDEKEQLKPEECKVGPKRPKVQQAVSLPSASKKVVTIGEKEQHKQKREECKSVAKQPKEQEAESLPPPSLPQSQLESTIGEKLKRKRKRVVDKSVAKQTIEEEAESLPPPALPLSKVESTIGEKVKQKREREVNKSVANQTKEQEAESLPPPALPLSKIESTIGEKVKQKREREVDKSVAKQPKEQHAISLPSSSLPPSKIEPTVGEKVKQKRERELDKSVPKQPKEKQAKPLPSTSTSLPQSKMESTIGEKVKQKRERGVDKSVPKQPIQQETESLPSLSLPQKKIESTIGEKVKQKREREREVDKGVPKQSKEQQAISLPSSPLPQNKIESTIGEKVKQKREREREKVKSVLKQSKVLPSSSPAREEKSGKSEKEKHTRERGEGKHVPKQPKAQQAASLHLPSLESANNEKEKPLRKEKVEEPALMPSVSAPEKDKPTVIVEQQSENILSDATAALAKNKMRKRAKTIDERNQLGKRRDRTQSPAKKTVNKPLSVESNVLPLMMPPPPTKGSLKQLIDSNIDCSNKEKEALSEPTEKKGNQLLLTPTKASRKMLVTTADSNSPTNADADATSLKSPETPKIKKAVPSPAMKPVKVRLKRTHLNSEHIPGHCPGTPKSSKASLDAADDTNTLEDSLKRGKVKGAKNRLKVKSVEVAPILNTAEHKNASEPNSESIKVSESEVNLLEKEASAGDKEIKKKGKNTTVGTVKQRPLIDTAAVSENNTVKGAIVLTSKRKKSIKNRPERKTKKLRNGIEQLLEDSRNAVTAASKQEKTEEKNNSTEVNEVGVIESTTDPATIEVVVADVAVTEAIVTDTINQNQEPQQQLDWLPQSDTLLSSTSTAPSLVQENIEISIEVAAAASSLALLADIASTNALNKAPKPDLNEIPAKQDSYSVIASQRLPIQDIGDFNAGISLPGLTPSPEESGGEANEDQQDQPAVCDYFPTTISDLHTIERLTINSAKKSSSISLISFEATPTVPAYLFNGESRDVPTPLPNVEEVEPIVPFAAAPIASIQAEVPEMAVDSSSLGLSTSDHEVSSTQETIYETAKRNSGANPAKAKETISSATASPAANVESIDATAMLVQNNQVDTTHHLPEIVNDVRWQGRRLSDDVSSMCELQGCQIKQRRKTFCATSSFDSHYIRATSTEMPHVKSSGTSPSTTTTFAMEVIPARNSELPAATKQSTESQQLQLPKQRLGRSFSTCTPPPARPPHECALKAAQSVKCDSPGELPSVSRALNQQTYENAVQKVFVSPQKEKFLDKEVERAPKVQILSAVDTLPFVAGSNVTAKRNARCTTVLKGGAKVKIIEQTPSAMEEKKLPKVRRKIVAKATANRRRRK